MANQDNQCSKLVVENKYNEETLHLEKIFKIQAFLQKEVYGLDFKNMTLEELIHFWHTNTHALIDEIHEATDAIGGIKDGIGNAVWKTWKKDHILAKQRKISDLSETDKLELKFEIIDILHFFINMALSVDMTAEEVYNMYISKNSENIKRQESGY